MSSGRRGSRSWDFPENRNHAHDFIFPGWSQTKRPLNSRIEDCCAGGMGDAPHPEIEDVHSSSMRIASPRAWLRRLFEDCIKAEKDQAWLEEDRVQPETGYPTQYVRYVEINPGKLQLRYRWMSSKHVLLEISLPILFHTCLRVYYITDQAFRISGSVP